MLTRQFLTVREVADLLKVGEVTVRHWIKGRELRAIDVGREWRIAPSDLEHFLRRHETSPQSNGTMPQDPRVNPLTEELKTARGEVKRFPTGETS